MITDMKTSVDITVKREVNMLNILMAERCKASGLATVDIKLSATEKMASKIIPGQTHVAATMGYEGDMRYIKKLHRDFLDAHPYANLVNPDEVAGLANGKRNILVIKKIVDSEFEKETPVEDILNFFSVLKEAGLVEYR